jgi:hypothetical protein
LSSEMRDRHSLDFFRGHGHVSENTKLAAYLEGLSRMRNLCDSRLPELRANIST